MQQNNCELNQLKIKNFPSSFTSDDKINFLKYFNAIDLIIERDFVLAKFKNEGETNQFLRNFHQKQILDRRLRVEYYTKNFITSTISSDAAQKTTVMNNINEYILKWLAINPDLDFNQPPSPYLRYKYPKITQEIIDSICVALESVPKFYTQVLHLMNKMNLPPPFTPADVEKMKYEKKFVSKASQTEISNVRGVKRKIYSGGELIDDESELESEEDDRVASKNNPPDVSLLKRPKKSSKIVMQNPVKRFLQNIPTQGTKDVLDVSKIFEGESRLQTKKIEFHVPKEIKPIIDEKPASKAPSEANKLEETQKMITRQDLASNRLSSDQFANLPVFKNYQKGEKSNKLYIKNLAKTVTVEDLEQIYGNFTKKSKNEVEVKLMTSGRMKGQAFITFSTPYDEDDLEENKDRMIDMALNETNGFLLKDKPMVVMYAKSSNNQ